jgi:hypothetical protein
MSEQAWNPDILLRPKGYNRTAQGFSPGWRQAQERPVRAAEWRVRAWVKFGDLTMKNRRKAIFRRPPFQGGSVGDASPGLKPWAVLFSPLGRRVADDR